MTPDDAKLHDVIDKVARETGVPLDADSLRMIARPPGKGDVADATIAFRVAAPAPAKGLVILLSNPAFPVMVAEAVEMADRVAAALSDHTGARVLRPLTQGEVAGQSYAAYRQLQPPSDHRAMRFLEKRLSARHVVGWLTDVAVESRQPVDERARVQLYAEPLAALAAEEALADALRRFADMPEGRVVQSEGLISVVEHGDFWLGNILFEPRPLPLLAAQRGDFAVIDWRGARFDGYPAIDLVRYALSSRPMGAASIRRDLEAYRRRLSLSRGEISISVLAAVGRLGMHLEEFPKARYLALAERVYRCLVMHGYAEM